MSALTKCTNKNIGTHKLLENNEFTIWQIHLEPGEELPPHLHDKPYFWTVLTDGYARALYDDGSVIEVEYKKGDTKYFPDLTSKKKFIHSLINQGQSPLVFVTVEFHSVR
ncbi:cupin domain-containing protein [Buttiauxella warmboldiae]|uniref:Cupin domain-containing protein n=1 Tax=Buttiauxella warmboldiae TaxID=82993 RepID=A0A3N5D610_9ENTR|nr:cupin domain-containing protein [Buttiauxella warmboldiae]